MTLTRRQWALIALVTLLWGLNWPMMKFALREVSPLYFRAITMSGGTLTLIAFFAWRGVPLGVSRGQALRLLWLALPNIIGWHLCSIIGLSQLPSGRAVILAFTMPVWTVLLTVLLFGERMNARTWLAVVAGVASVGLLAANELVALAGRPIGVLWLQGGALSWAVATWVEPWPAWGLWPASTWGSLGFGVFLNFGFAQVIWFSLVRALPARASAFGVMAVPLVGISSATVIVGEVLRPTDWLAAVCIAVAIFSATGGAARPARSDNPAP